MIIHIPNIPNPLSEAEEQQINDLAYKLATPQGLTGLNEEEKNIFNKLIKIKLDHSKKQYEYIKTYNCNKAAIMSDIKKILSVVTKEDFKAYANKPRIKDRISHLGRFEQSYGFLEGLLCWQLMAYHYYNFDDTEIYPLILKKAEQWYKKPDNFTIKKNPEFDLDNANYLYCLQNKEINALGHTSSKSFDDMNYATNSITHDDVELSVMSPEKFSDVNWNVNARKVCDMAYNKLNDILPRGENVSLEMIDRNRTVELTVKEFAEKCNISERHARDYLNEAGKALFQFSVKCPVDIPQTEEKKSGRGKRKKTEQQPEYKRRRIISAINEDESGGSSVVNGSLKLTFDIDFAKYLSSHSRAMPRHNNNFRINANINPHSYDMAKKLQEHYYMNVGKSNSNRIAVKSLQKELPNLPSYDDVMNGDRHIDQRIIKPFEKDLDALVKKYDILEKWNYCNKQGEPLTNEQLHNYDYISWNEWLIEFTLKDYPKTTEKLRLAEYKEKQKKAQKAKSKRNTAARAKKIKV